MDYRLGLGLELRLALTLILTLTLTVSPNSRSISNSHPNPNNPNPNQLPNVTRPSLCPGAERSRLQARQRGGVSRPRGIGS